MDKTCRGYTSDGSGGQQYSQGPHVLENNTQNFGPGKSQCRTCYGVYARDWKAKRGVGGTPRAVKSQSVIVFPDFRAPALDGRASSPDGEELVSEDDAARSHEFVPQPDLIETWGAVTRSAEDGSHPFNLIFLGESGTGKTEAAQYLAALVGLPFTKVDAPAMTDAESWFGTREVVAEDGVSITSYRPSAFVLAVEQPGVLLIDEMNRSRDEHRNVLLSLMDGTHQCTNPLTGDVVRKHPRCFIIMTGNRGLQYTGTYAIDPAFLTRSLTINFDYAPEAAEVKIAQEASECDEETAKLMVAFAVKARELSKNDQDLPPVSTREVIYACRLVHKGLSPDAAVRAVVTNAASPEGGPSSVRMKFEQLWAGLRAQVVVDKPTTRACGVAHPFLFVNGAPVKCVVEVSDSDPGHSGNPQHKSTDSNGDPVGWMDQP